MAQSKKSQGLCEKIHNAVAPFRTRIRRIPDKPRPPISVNGDKSSVKNTCPQSKTVPVEFRHSAAHFSAQNSKNESESESESESDGREIAIIRGQKFAKSADQLPPPPPPPHHEDSHSVHHEGKFSDYISKFKNRMKKSASHVGGGGSGGGGNSMRRYSFNDKVSNYIDQAKIKIRTTTFVGVDHTTN